MRVDQAASARASIRQLGELNNLFPDVHTPALLAIAAAELGCWEPVDRAHAQLIRARDSSISNGATFWAARCHAGLVAPAGNDNTTSTGETDTSS